MLSDSYPSKSNEMKTTIHGASASRNSATTSKVLKIVWKKFLEQFESPNTRNYRRLKDFLSNG